MTLCNVQSRSHRAQANFAHPPLSSALKLRATGRRHGGRWVQKTMSLILAPLKTSAAAEVAWSAPRASPPLQHCPPPPPSFRQRSGWSLAAGAGRSPRQPGCPRPPPSSRPPPQCRRRGMPVPSGPGRAAMWAPRPAAAAAPRSAPSAHVHNIPPGIPVLLEPSVCAQRRCPLRSLSPSCRRR